jgi:hypothetical protein
MPALTVWSVCVGDKYHRGYVYALKEAVEKYLGIPHTFKCVTEHRLPGIETVKPVLPYGGWWSKLNLFALATGPSLYFDLDVVITGKLDYLAGFTHHEFAAPANWARSGHGGIQSSVMAWRGNWTAPFDKIRSEWPGEVDGEGYRTLGGKKYWGDQEYLHELLGDRWMRIPRGIYSFKYHVLNGGLPKDSSVIVFHGQPKPHEVIEEEWIPEWTKKQLRRSSSIAMAPYSGGNPEGA